jgi:L-galactose dehydrogenase
LLLLLPLQIISETLPALQQLKSQGLVRFVGITGLPLTALQYVLDRVPAGAALVVCRLLQAAYRVNF